MDVIIVYRPRPATLILKLNNFFFLDNFWLEWKGNVNAFKSAAITDGKFKRSLEKQDSSEMNYYL
jgi:hypothetical protein